MAHVFRRRTRHEIAPLLVGVLISIAVCWPWAGRGGRLLLLDWVIGPHPHLLSRSAHGLDGGVASGVPLQVVVGAVDRFLGAPSTWLPIAVLFPLAATGAARLCRHGGAGLAGCLAAAIFYCVNPMVFDRIGAGQIAFLLGYALLPHAVVALLEGADRGWRGGWVPGLWFAALAGCSAHYAWIVAVLVLALLIAVRVRVRALACVAIAAMVAGASSLYLLVGPAVGSHQISASAGVDLVAYRTTGGSSFDRVVHVLGLYGFWREVPYEPRTVLSGWWLLLVVLLFLAGVGYVDRLRRPRAPGGRSVAVVLLIAAGLGLLLALGDQGPAGSVFRWMYWHVHAFQAMREPQKFAALVALGLCVGFGWGVDVLTRDLRRRVVRVAAGLALAALAVAYTPTLFDGLDGHLSTSTLPADWAAADRAVGSGPQSAVLFLPWHLYLAFPFTDARVIANPANDFFRRPVISGDNVELPNVADESPARRSAYLVEEMANARTGGTAFGSRLAPLGVGYVVLAKTADWPGYDWLNRQQSLVKVLDTAAITVWQVTATDPLTQRVSRRSPTAYSVVAGSPGPITVPEPFDSGWHLGGQRPQATPEGVLRFTAGPGPAAIRFTPWSWVRTGYWLSAVMAALSGLLAFATRRSVMPAVRRLLTSRGG